MRCYEPRTSVRQCAAMSHCDLNIEMTGLAGLFGIFTKNTAPCVFATGLRSRHFAPACLHFQATVLRERHVAKVSNNTTIASRGATASGVSPIQLSVWKESGEKKDYSKATAMQVSASTLAHLIPEKGVQEAIPSDVWELPCITILNIAKNADDAWGYKGCSICSKKVCAHAAAERTCYNMDVEVSDHTATVEMKMWTQTMDPLLRSCGVDTPEGGVSDVDRSNRRTDSKQALEPSLRYR